MKSKFLKSIVIIIGIICFMFNGCISGPSNKVVINKKFLFDIEKAFKEEAISGCDKSEIYNMLWEKNYYELVYLAEKGDRKAIDVSISLIGQKGYPTCLLEHIEILVRPTFESDTDYFWKSLSEKEHNTQVKVLRVFDFYKPLDWDTEDYLSKHQEIKNLYDTKE